MINKIAHWLSPLAISTSWTYWQYFIYFVTPFVYTMQFNSTADTNPSDIPVVKLSIIPATTPNSPKIKMHFRFNRRPVKRRHAHHRPHPNGPSSVVKAQIEVYCSCEGKSIEFFSAIFGNCAISSATARPKVSSTGVGSDSRSGRTRVQCQWPAAGEISVKNSEKFILQGVFHHFFFSPGFEKGVRGCACDVGRPWFRAGGVYVIGVKLV